MDIPERSQWRKIIAIAGFILLGLAAWVYLTLQDVRAHQLNREDNDSAYQLTVTAENNQPPTPDD